MADLRVLRNLWTEDGARSVFASLVTHCVYHRIPTANNIGNPNDLYNDGNSTVDERKNAKDLILRLDGHVDTLDVSAFNVSKAWITQEK